MKRIITTTIIALSLLLGLALWTAGRNVKAKTTLAVSPTMTSSQLNPNDFTSLGASPFSSAGTYTIEASKDNPAPTLSGTGILTPIQGVFHSPSGGMAANDEIAVFTFNSISIPAGVTVSGAQNANSRPIALLSRSTATIDGTINVSGANGANNSGSVGENENGGNGGNAGPGGGGGGGGGGRTPGSGGVGFVNGSNGGFLGGNGGSVVAGGAGTNGEEGGGGAFGGNGGNSATFGLGGTAYGDLTMTLQGGSGGAGATTLSAGGGGGGAGGGTVEIGAAGNIALGGTVLAKGGTGGDGELAGFDGGGGAGGGILVHAQMVSLSGNLNAIGGMGGVRQGGGGGGGRVLILTADGMLASGSLAANVNVSGGASGGSVFAQPGQSGVAELGIGLFLNQSPVAQCQNMTVSARAAGGGGGGGGGGSACTANASIDNGSYDPDSGDTISLSQSPAGPYPLGSTTVTLTVTDSRGASSSCMAVVTVVDQTAPTITCPANIVTYLPPNSMDTSKLVTYPTPTATDNCGIASVTTSQASGSAFQVGTTTVSVTATDAAGNQSQCSFTVTVLYNFTGFFQPVDNPPMVNTVNAGRAIPVKFSLSGNKGLNIFAASYPISQQVACTGGPPDDIEQTVTAGGSSLSYNATTGQYTYVWSTDSTWKNTCRQLVVKLNDGSTHVANFQFK